MRSIGSVGVNAKVAAMGTWVVLLWVACWVLGSARGEVYMVLLDGEPVVSYRGTVPGLSATHGFNPECNLSKKLCGSGVFDAPRSPAGLASGVHHRAGRPQALQLQLPPQRIRGRADARAGVKRVERSQRVSTCTTHTPDYLGLSNGVWTSSGGPQNAGEGIVIGVVDTGIDPTHPSFQNTSAKPFGPLASHLGICEVHSSFPAGSCNGKIISAQHFAAAAKSEGAFNSTIDFDSPLDGDGHGTHTASIAAGNHGVPVIVNNVNYGNASGMAPRARIAVYKALYRLFGGFNADVVAAIDQAVKDGVDVLNLSLGPNTPPADTTITFLSIFDLACLAAVKAGVVVLQAAGNGGPYPQTTLSFSPWITTVAAGVDDRTYPNFLDLGNNLKLRGEGLAPASGALPSNMVLAQDVVTGVVNPLYDPSDCQDSASLDKAKVAGNLLICTYSFNFIYGGSTIRRVEDTVRNLSAAGFVMIVQSDTAASRFDPIPITLPGIVITSLNESMMLLDYYNTTTLRNTKGQAETFGAKGKIGNGQVAAFSGQAPIVALFSSRGPDIRDFSFNSADVLKPNVLAPGSLIWAAWTPIGVDEPNFKGQNFAMISGTSMATPHIAGIAAIILEKNPTWSPAFVSSALTTTATNLDAFGNPLQAQHIAFAGDASTGTGTPFDYGHGAVNATAAMDPGIVFDANYEDYIKFVCTVPGVTPAAVFNLTGSRCNVSASDHPTGLNVPAITIATLNGTRVVPRTVTSVSNSSETWSVRVDQPDGVNVTVSPRNFTIAPSARQTFTVTISAAANSSIFVFGEIYLTGSLGHRAHLPISIIQSQTAR